MRLYFCSSDVGCFQFLFTTDDQRASQLFTIYLVLARLQPTVVGINELTPESMLPDDQEDLREALSRGIEAFASFEPGEGWVVQSIQETFQALSDEAGGGGQQC